MDVGLCFLACTMILINHAHYRLTVICNICISPLNDVTLSVSAVFCAWNSKDLCYAELDSETHLKAHLNALDSFCDDISMVHGNQRNTDACHFTKLSGPDT